jgi:hypothetical protein
MKTSPNVLYKEFVDIQDVAKKLTGVPKIVCYNPRKWPRHFSRIRTSKPFWPRDLRLVVLCIKLWLVHGGGTIRVSKFIIVSSIWASNYKLQRHLNGPKKARNVNPRVQKSMKTSPNVFYKESVHIRDVAKKFTRALKIVCYNPRKWPETDVFRENAPVNPSGPETYA